MAAHTAASCLTLARGEWPECAGHAPPQQSVHVFAAAAPWSSPSAQSSLGAPTCPGPRAGQRGAAGRVGQGLEAGHRRSSARACGRPARWPLKVARDVLQPLDVPDQELWLPLHLRMRLRASAATGGQRRAPEPAPARAWRAGVPAWPPRCGPSRHRSWRRRPGRTETLRRTARRRPWRRPPLATSCTGWSSAGVPPALSEPVSQPGRRSVPGNKRQAGPSLPSDGCRATASEPAMSVPDAP